MKKLLTCADDLALLSDSKEELQLMTNIVGQHAKRDRVTIHPDKSNAVLLAKAKSFKKESFSLQLDDREIQLTNNTTHLGILRSESNENIANIDDRIKLARRTLYSLIGTGVHGSNGLNPKVSYRIYQCYVIPRLLYGLEVIPITDSQLELISKFHIKTLKRIQSLPTRTANCATLLLLGALPIKAELHKRQLGLLYNLLHCENDTILSLTNRQSTVNCNNHLSYFSKVQDLLDMYSLPDIQTLKHQFFPKSSWKLKIKDTIHSFWLNILKEEADAKSSLKFLYTEQCSIGKPHPVWDSLDTTTTEVKKGLIKCRMLTGTYMVQSTNHKFSNGVQNPVCKSCGLKEEDLAHVLLNCPSYHNIRKPLLQEIASLCTKVIGKQNWLLICKSDYNILKLLLDSGNYQVLNKSKFQPELEKIGTDLCYRIHVKRLCKLSSNKYKNRTVKS